MVLIHPKDSRLNARWKAFLVTKWSLVAVDIVAINVALIFGFWFRMQSGVFHTGLSVEPSLGLDHVRTMALVSVITLYIFKSNGLYREAIFSERFTQAQLVLKSVTLSVLLLLATTFMAKEGHFTERRSILFFAWATLLALELVVRCGLLAYVMRLGSWRKEILVLGAGKSGRYLVHQLNKSKRMGYDVVGFLDDHPDLIGKKFEEVPVLGRVEDLGRVADEYGINEVFISISSMSHRRMLDIVALCKHHDLSVRILSDLFDVLTTRVHVETVGNLPLIRLKETPLQGLNLILKRTVDFTGAFLGILILSPLFLFLAAAIKLTSKGPVFYIQRRVGRNGREFDLYKFRSMRMGNDDRSHREYVTRMIRGDDVSVVDGNGRKVHKMVGDARITPAGRFMRRLSLDEFPQLFNVLKGDMSLVGPRPPIPYEVAAYDQWHRKRLEVLPGITGLWQVNGRNETRFEEMVLLDMYYIENWSFPMDVKILLRTVPAVVRRNGH
ncbi:MAG: sugar transferase [Planctomycetota bacterium]